MAMRVPFIDLGRLTRRLREPVLADWASVFDRNEFVGGPTVKRLEERLAGVCGLPHVVSCANGTDALIVGLQLFGLPRGARVALPNLTFWATYEAIAQLGLVPVLIDVDPGDGQMSYDAFVSAHEATRFSAAILPHLFGWTSRRLADFRAFCRAREIPLLEDGAQCFGVEVAGAPILAGAQVATLSFYPAKVVGGAMDGGAILTATEADAQLARTLCNHGRSTHYSYSHVGWNSRMGGLQAAFILRVLDELPFILGTRRAAMARYAERAAGLVGARFMGPPEGVTTNGYLSVFLTDGRGEALVKALAEAGIGAARTYPETMDAQPCTADAIRHGSLEASRAFCRDVVNLPLFAGIEAAECDLALDELRRLLA